MQEKFTSKYKRDDPNQDQRAKPDQTQDPESTKGVADQQHWMKLNINKRFIFRHAI